MVNLSGQPAQGRIPLDWPDLPGHPVCLTDLLRHEGYDPDGTELAAPGLFVSVGPFRYHLFAVG